MRLPPKPTPMHLYWMTVVFGRVFVDACNLPFFLRHRVGKKVTVCTDNSIVVWFLHRTTDSSRISFADTARTNTVGVHVHVIHKISIGCCRYNVGANPNCNPIGRYVTVEQHDRVVGRCTIRMNHGQMTIRVVVYLVPILTVIRSVVTQPLTGRSYVLRFRSFN